MYESKALAEVSNVLFFNPALGSSLTYPILLYQILLLEIFIQILIMLLKISDKKPNLKLFFRFIKKSLKTDGHQIVCKVTNNYSNILNLQFFHYLYSLKMVQHEKMDQ